MQEFNIITLDNGLRCIHRRVKSEVAHLSITIGAGTRDEQEQQHGVAHLVEHLLFKGTSNHKSYYINSAIDAVGGELNAFTAKEETVLHATCLRSYARKCADLLMDMALNSNFTQHDIEKEKEVIIDEINSYKDSPSELIFDEFEELLFAGSSLGRSILGNKRTIKKAKQADLQQFCRDNYSLKNMVFAISSSHSVVQFEAFCQRAFGGLTSDNECDTQHQMPQKVERFDLVRNKRLYQAHTVIGGYGPSIYAKNRLAGALLINILGGPSALSRMNMQMREKHALTYNCEATYCPFSDIGLYTLYFSCEENKIEKAEKILMQEIEKLTSNSLSVRGLQKYKKQLVGQMLISNENNESSMLGVAKSMLLYNKCESTSKTIDRINAITAQEVQDVAQEMFNQQNMYKLSYR